MRVAAPLQTAPTKAPARSDHWWSRTVDAVQRVAGKVDDVVDFAGGVTLGAAKEGVNTLTNLVKLPIYTRAGGWFWVQGPLWDPSGKAQRIGAGAVDAAARAAGMLAKPANRAAERAVRPLLTAFETAGHAERATRLQLDATAPGAAWGSRGATSGLVSVYVDGSHTADVVVLNERTGPVGVNLGVLGSGQHRIEIRDASGGTRATVATQIRGAAAETMSADDSLIARFQPLVEGRDLGLPSRVVDSVDSDTPLVLVPTVRRNADGSRTIRYYALLSNEDGGTSTARLYRDHGRASDFEHIYTVQVDPSGERTGAWYQGPRHAWKRFEGKFADDRAVLRWSTSNNMVTENALGAGAVWSPACTPAGDTPRGLTTMLEHPWTFRVMGNELIREHRIGSAILPDPLRIEDPRRYVYLAGLDDEARRTLERGGAIPLVLRNGNVRDLVMADGPSRYADHETAIPLPDGVHGDDVVGMRGIRGSVWVLDETLVPRRLASRRA